jgi:hypothetical protein
MSYSLLDIFLLFWLLQGVPSTPFGRYNVVRIDESNHRLFVVKSDSFINNHRELKHFLLTLRKEIGKTYPGWTNTFSVSIFNNEDAAGYKDEPKVEGFIRNNTWSKLYIVEYSDADHSCIIHPLIPKKRLKLIISN